MIVVRADNIRPNINFLQLHIFYLTNKILKCFSNEVWVTSRKGFYIYAFRRISAVYIKSLTAPYITRCNSVWLECLLWEQDAAGSSPVTSTIKGRALLCSAFNSYTERT